MPEGERYLSPNCREFRTHSAPDIVLTTSTGEEGYPEVFDGVSSSHLSISADNIYSSSWDCKVYVYCCDMKHSQDSAGSYRMPRKRTRSASGRLTNDTCYHNDSSDFAEVPTAETLYPNDISNATLALIGVVMFLASTVLIMNHYLSSGHPIMWTVTTHFVYHLRGSSASPFTNGIQS